MASFDLVEIPFGSDDFEQTIEDEFLLTKLKKEIEAVTDIEQLRQGALKLLQLAILRQSMIRGLVRRLGAAEQNVMRTRYED
jgi:hypothetical protein